jgi:hypothetical protein
MNTKTIDITNIGLMIASCALAYVIPFELFLFSYAVLGPLHYLTEITWLKKRDCFTTGKKDYIFLVLPCLIMTVIVLVYTYNDQPVIKDMYATMQSVFGPKISDFPTVMIALAFFSALAFVLFKDWLYKLIFIFVAFLVGILIQDSQPSVIFFAIFLPTIVHVYVFTGFFIINGALKNRSVTGIASATVFILCALIFFIWKPSFSFYNVTGYARDAIFLNGKGMIALNAALINLFQMGQITMESVFQSKVGLGIGRFIAFAYTYHYLNWFSKTEIIKWHKIPAKWLAAVIVLWISSIVLYAYDYKTGLMTLYFLSMLHVFLEFPLNYRSVIGIGEEVLAISGLKKAPAPVVKRKQVLSPVRKN